MCFSIMRDPDLAILSYDHVYDPDCESDSETLYLHTDGTYYLQYGSQDPQPYHLIVPQAGGYPFTRW